ncbi:helix-turn-helix transcriptional regulator [Zunongwangia profunda]|jgi:AraC-like DNA-binding protein|uniref:helix-turn-helix transcriptional regulator n=1 Tax=Zunongwangia profunda TaxID=398743 RepID=UPI000C9947AB|nr:AraC family transcriptional regulator [Zunongwangia profunda]MAG88419.1 AraC family transcriptional regulator [Flavobacteriaceae bacterium]MCC4228162.1 AraC family transcriptional regulator [Zunongwangia profunda]|tara:strand:+ start:2541 stop:3557 length:1017 start_codon:yes stop_codon:yes gene_type:complete
MKVIEVNSIPIDEVIKDIGRAISQPVSENCKQVHLDIPSHLGKGTISGINFNNGFGFIHYNCIFHVETEIQFVVDKIHPLKFLYMLEGDMVHRFEGEEEKHRINQYQHAILANSQNRGHILQFSKAHQLSLISIEIDRRNFIDKIDCELKGIEYGLRDVFLDVKAQKEFYHKGFYSLKIADLFRESEQFEKNDFTRRIFLEALTMKMLSYELEKYEDELKTAREQRILTHYEVKSIKKAANYIEDRISKNPSLEELSRYAGLNKNKLQYGFQVLFHTSVHTYLQQTRLKMMKTLLLNTDLTIGEISTRIGISSYSYFSRIFKEKYDVSPMKFRKLNRL